MSSWSKKKLKLKPGHNWQVKKGHKIVVLDRGAVRFDIPEAWIVVPESDSIKIYDKQPPQDDCVLAASHIRLPPMDWSGLPLSKLLDAGIQGDERPITDTGKIIESRRADLEIAWREMQFVDPKEQRDALSRILIGRRKVTQCLITFDFWVSDLERCNPVWKTVLETLVLGEFVSDPTTGKKR